MQCASNLRAGRRHGFSSFFFSFLRPPPALRLSLYTPSQTSYSLIGPYQFISHFRMSCLCEKQPNLLLALNVFAQSGGNKYINLNASVNAKDFSKKLLVLVKALPSSPSPLLLSPSPPHPTLCNCLHKVCQMLSAQSG